MSRGIVHNALLTSGIAALLSLAPAVINLTDSSAADIRIPVTKAPPPPPRPVFEIEIWGGSDYGRFPTIGPIGLTQDVFPRRHVLTDDLKGWFATAGGHVLYRPQTWGPFGADAYRLDVRYRDGNASQADGYFNPVGIALAVPSVAASTICGFNVCALFGGAVSHNISGSIEQHVRSFEVKPSLVWERKLATVSATGRLGVGYSFIRDGELIRVSGIDPTQTVTTITTTGDLRTDAIGVVAGLDLRAPLNHMLSLVGTIEATLDSARTRYAGQSTIDYGLGPLVIFNHAVVDSRRHAMAGLRLAGGAELTVVPNLTIGVLGHVAWQHNAPFIAYPQAALDAFGNPFAVIGGPAHIGFEDRHWWGWRAAARWQM